MWIFGYGSLIWRPNIPYVRREVAHVRGYQRRFWQGSPDHRGVPGAPGRVVTLVEDPKATCAGVAYRVPEREIETVVAQLDHREQGGYTRCEVAASLGEGRMETVTFYVATSDNPWWLGPAPLGDMVEQIASCQGPSGSNREYLLRLDQALRQWNLVDEHVHELATQLRQRDNP